LTDARPEDRVIPNLRDSLSIPRKWQRSQSRKIVLVKFIDKILGRSSEGRDAADRGRKKGALAEIPDFNDEGSPVVEEANLARAQRTFETYNANKAEFLYEQLSPRKRVVYDLVPLLIHVDAADLLVECSDACHMSPHGVYAYQTDARTEASFKEAFPGKRFPKLRSQASLDPSLPVKSMSLIGSLGSIAQNNKSDFDYWVCFDNDVFSRESFIYFTEKLREIEQWADEFGGAEVHFFPLDMDKVRANDFGAVSGESSGTALGKLLKEEFYRTMTMVAGQTPLWWVMPPGVTDQDYARLAEVIYRSSRVDASQLVDMGNVSGISLGEFYGAAVWQINKTMGSPFKSILKMALLEEYMHNHGSKGLLCTELKQRLWENPENIDIMDPYILMFERASAYLTEQGRSEDLDLLRRSLYMKSGAKLVLADHRRPNLPRKKQVMINLIRQWGWTQRTIDKLNNFQYWSFKDTQRFSKETNRFIIRTYKNVSAELNTQQEEVGLVISQRDLTVLGRKLFIYYSKRTNKVDSIKTVIESPPALSGVTLQPYPGGDDLKIWAAYRALLSREAVESGKGVDSMLMRSPDLTEVLMWLVNNQLYDASTSINLNSGEDHLGTHCTVPDIQTLLKGFKAFFPPYRHSEIDEEELLQKPRIARMFLVLNLEEPDHATSISDVGVCYQNNWGEIFFKGYRGRDAQNGLKISRDFVRKHFAYDPLSALSNFKVFLPERQFKKSFRPKLTKYFGMKCVI
jgi:adenylate cyclase class 1